MRVMGHHRVLWACDVKGIEELATKIQRSLEIIKEMDPELFREEADGTE